MARCKNEHTYVSHPVRVRGLKQIPAEPASDDEGVAPREGAWIETVISFKSVPASIVAPREGAWIETFRRSCLKR